MRDFRRFVAYFLRRPRPYVWGFVTMAGSTAFFLAMPRLVGRAIEDLEAELSGGRIARPALLIVLLAVGDAICLFLTRRLLIGASRDIEYEMREDLFAHLLKLAARLVPEAPRRRPHEPGRERPRGGADDDRPRHHAGGEHPVRRVVSLSS